MLYVLMPVAFGITACGLSAAIPLSFGRVVLVGLLAGGWFSLFSWLDTVREMASKNRDPLRAEKYVTRAVAAFCLPYVLTPAWIVVAYLYGAELGVLHFIIPFITGAFVGRAAIEQHYLVRPKERRVQGGPHEIFDKVTGRNRPQ